MKMINKIFGMLMLAAAATFAVSCSDDDVDTSMSVIKDSQTPQNDLDKWLYANYVKPYNVELRYRWEDNETSMDYILVPPTYQNAVRMARLLKFICFDAFDEVTGSTKFIHDHFPKLVQLVGNPGWNTNSSMTLGSSEGGYKINLWYVNHLGDMVYENWVPKDSVLRDRQELNAIFFHTIIHEFGHNFHQKVPYSTEFNQITGNNYLGGMYTSEFESTDDPQVQAMGFTHIRPRRALYLQDETAHTMTALAQSGMTLVGGDADSADVMDWLTACGATAMSGPMTGVPVEEDELIRDCLLAERA